MQLQQSKAFSLLELIVSLSLFSIGLLAFTTALYPLLKQHSKLHERNTLQSALSALEAHIQSVSFQDVHTLLKETREIFIYKDASGKANIVTQASQLQQLIHHEATAIFPLQKIKIEVLSPIHFAINPSNAIYLKLFGTTLYSPSDLNKQATWHTTRVFIKNR